MCLGALTTVIEVDPGGLTARVDDGTAVRTVSLALEPHVRVGDHVVVHTGFVVSRADATESAAIDRLGGLQP